MEDKNTRKRKVYIHSDTRDYIADEYVELFDSMNAELIKGTEEDFTYFVNTNAVMQLDVETNVTDRYTDRELYVVQLGTTEGDVQHIFDIKDCDKQQAWIKELISDKAITFLAHNAKFEYIVMYKHFGVYISTFQDTFLASKLITAGLELPKGYNGLAGLVYTRFGIDLSKSAQTTFTGEMMSPEQLLYADTDVLYLGKLLRTLMPTLKKWNLMKVFKLENKALRPIGDLTINGVEINTDALDENIITYDKAALIAKTDMINAFKAEPDNEVANKIKEMNVVQGQDEIVINWKSSVQKRKILQYFYPEEGIQSTAKAVLTKLEKSVSDPKILTMYLNDNTEDIETLLVSRHFNFLVANDMLIEKGALNLNFNSPTQLLEFFRLWYPKLDGVGVKALKKLKNPVIMGYKKYSKAQKLVSSFGRKMYDFIEEDGRIHANFTAMTQSGSRMSSQKPNQQQAPSTEAYRRMYVPRKGWKLVDSDYSSMELFLAAYLSGDKKMIYAIEQGYDLHSYCSYLLFGEEWLAAGGSKTPIGKPPNAEVNGLRKRSKGLSFSILYGTGVVAFSENGGISVAEGKRRITLYGETFPELVKYFKKSGEDALKYNFIREPYFGRVRFFNKPKNGMEASHNKNAGMNYRPQAANGSILKYAMCLIKKYIEDNDLDDKVKLLLNIHDYKGCDKISLIAGTP